MYLTEFDRANGIGGITATLGGPDVIQLLAHDVDSVENNAYRELMSPGMERYPERALLLARPDDIVCVLHKVDEEYLRFLSSLGIGPKSGNVVIAEGGIFAEDHASLADRLAGSRSACQRIRELLRTCPYVALSPYIVSPRELKLAEVLQRVLGRDVQIHGGSPDLVRRVNHKHHVRAVAARLGVPLAEGEVVRVNTREDGSPLDVGPVAEALRRYLHRTGRALIRGSHSLSGSAAFIVENSRDSIQTALSRIALASDNQFYLVEVMHEVASSPNVLMHIDPLKGNISCVGATEQILDKNLVHRGNICPPEVSTLPEMIAASWKLSRWLRLEGYSGFAGFDFCEVIHPETRRRAYFFAEMNARVNGSAYIRALMEHLNAQQERSGRAPIEAFLSVGLNTKATSFAELRASFGHLFFNPESGRGLAPYLTGWLDHGKLAVAVLGASRREVFEMYQEVLTYCEALPGL